MAFNSCKGCVAPKRHPGCHGICEDYIRDKAEYDALMETVKKKQEISHGITSQRTASVTRAMKGRRS